MFVAPPALILLACLLEDAALAVKSQTQRLAAIAGLTLGALTVLPWALPAYDHFLSFIQPPSGRTIPVPRAGSALFPEEFALDLDRLIHAIQIRTSPNEPIWVFPGEALLYFLADRPQPTHFPQALFAITREQRQELVADLERNRPRWTVVYRDAPDLEGIPYSVALPEVVEYLRAHYEFEMNIGAFELLRRQD
jgi:4-amino-4-deoxy-L-arabinose transferase-like glycosyltransferase